MNTLFYSASLVVLSSVSLNAIAFNEWWALNPKDLQCRVSNVQPKDFLSLKSCNTEFFNKDNGTLYIKCRGELDSNMFFNKTFEGCYEMSKSISKK